MEVVNKDNPCEFKPRPYQDQLLEVALKKNVVIYLPTGAGKTYIALMALRHMSGVLQGSVKTGGKRSAFLCNTVALAKQQYEVIRRSTNLKVAVYTGDMNVDNWKYDRWISEFENNQVIVATVQIVVDVIRHGYISVKNFNLIIFDECHHARGDHPMFQLLGLFKNHAEYELPRVIGLTGLLIDPSSKNTIVEELNGLEATYRGQIVTVENIDEFRNVLIYSTKPTEKILTYEIYQERAHVHFQIESIVQECLKKIGIWDVNVSHLKLTKSLAMIRAPNPIKKLENLFKDFLYQMNDMGLYAASVSILAVLVDLEIKKRAAETIVYRSLLRICIACADKIRHILVNKLYHEFDDDDDEKLVEEYVILSNSTHKLQSFLQYLKVTFTGKNPKDVKSLVFVQRRYTAKCLYHIIKRWVEHNPLIPINPEFMVGHASQSMPESVEQVLDAKWNKNVLNCFKKNESNLIVCSSVLEEGIDIQSCNHVIMFDKFQTFRSYIQTKGRARQNDSTYVIMVSSIDKPKLVQKLAEYKEIDTTLKKYLIEKTIDRSPPLQEEIDKQFETDIKPFYTPIGACLEATSVLALLGRYCSMLPNDSFTTSGIDWKRSDKQSSSGIMVRLLLPLQAPIRDEIWSDPKKNVKVAKQSAAFKACKMLYDIGELNDNLLPISKIKRAELVTPQYFNHWKDFNNDNPQTAGTKQNKRIYNIESPHQLRSAMPTFNKLDCLLYNISLIPLFESNEDNEHILQLFSISNSFAILTIKNLPKIAEMPLFMSYGEVRAKIAYEPIQTRIPNKNDLIYLRNFHVMIFRDLLLMWQQFLSNDFRNEDNSFLIVPTTTNGREIDWNLIKRFQSLSKIKEPSEIYRSKQKYNEPQDYQGNIVCPWYSADTTTRYVIMKVRQDLTPLSPFPSEEYKNFAHYILDKYDKSVIQTDQFLIEAKPITSQLNFLFYKNDGPKKKRKLDDILLIPELCHNFQFPGHLYLKAKFLPSIIHRLQHILLAENLRVKINSYLNLNFPNYSPQAIIVDKTLKRISEEEKKSKIVRSVVFPNPNEAVLKHISDLSTIIENRQYRWKDFEEPSDFTRMLDKTFKIEIDYYHQFITDQLNRMSIKNNNEILPDVNLASQNSLAAICDTPTDEKLHINIIDINEIKNSAEQWEFLSAITAQSSGDVFDMERVEVLGDSFLKFSISLFLLHKHPLWHEGHLTAVKGKFVSNRNLLYCAIKLNLPGQLNVSQFSPRHDWLPPLISIPSNVLKIINNNNVSPSVLWQLQLNYDEIEIGECKDEGLLKNFASNISDSSTMDTNIESNLNVFANKKVVSDKVCADSMEAIIGVCVKNYGIKKTFSVLEMLGICPKGNNLSNLLNLDLGSPRLKTNIPDKEVDAFLINYQVLEDKLGYKFKDRAYLLQALTHPSFPTNRITGCYQQLEFIGDAILDFLITCYIFEQCTNMDPGELTDIRSALVNNVTLACISVRNKFHSFMLAQNSALMQSVDKFVQFQSIQENKITDQVRILIHEDEKDPAQNMADYVDVPKALGDIFEAIIGAIFLDCKNDLKCTWKVIYSLMKTEIHEFMVNVPKQVVRQLYEYNGANPQFGPAVDYEDTVMVPCKFTCRDKICEVSGFGKNKEHAKKAAAKLALQVLTQA